MRDIPVVRISQWAKLAACLLLSTSLFAQDAPGRSGAKVDAVPKLETGNLDLTHTESIPGMPAATVVAYPRVCSSDGEIFSLIYATSGSDKVSNIPEVYGVSPSKAVRHLNIPLPQNFKYRSVRSFFPGKFSLLYLIQGTEPTGIEKTEEADRRQFFLAKTDREGNSPEIVRLQLPFQPIKLAALDNGDVLALGASETNLYPVLAFLHPDGALKRILTFDDRSYRQAILSGGAYVSHPDDTNTFALQRLVLGSLAKAQLIPWGSEVLLVQPGSKLPVFRIREDGRIEPVTITAPSNFLIQTVLGSEESDTWLAVVQDISSFVAVDTGKVAENPPQELLEIDPRTGRAVRAWHVTGPLPGEVSCGSDHKASAIYYGKPTNADGANDLMLAIAPR